MSHRRSALYEGMLTHTRFTPVRHAFRYPVMFAAIDLDEVDELDARLRLFGHNRLRPFSFRDRDHLGDRSRELKENVFGWLDERGVHLHDGQIQLVTNLRTFGYVFNPVSFYYCHDRDGNFVCAVAEVDNTFGERRPYLLDEHNEVRRHPDRRVWRHTKELHVSPFFGLDQEYEFELGPLGERTVAKVDVYAGGRRVLTAAQVGQRRPFDDRTLAHFAVRYPLMAHQVIGHIHLEALRLWRKRVPIHRKPPFSVADGSTPPPRPAPTRSVLREPPPAPSPLVPTTLTRRLTDWALARPAGGHLTIATPDQGRRRNPARDGGERQVSIAINSRNLYRRLITRRRLAIGESYVAGDWDADDLVAALEILLLTGEALRHETFGQRFTRALELRPHLSRRLGREPARKAIEYHYDLGNAFYELMLDPTMTYSCAVFAGPHESLEAAQRRKLRMICRKLRLGPDDRVLEIGCGWGSFALTAAGEFGAHVTGVTLSTAQHDEAVRRVRAAGLDDRIDIRLIDYRDLTGSFTKIASIEMFEAIGEAEFDTFFATCDRLLAPGGIACVQTIAIPDQRYERYRRTTDWLKEYIFPGSLLPSLSAITTSMTRASQLIVNDAQDIGIHYARTLACWAERFDQNIGRVRELGFTTSDERTWRFYLAACEAAFRTRAIHDYQLVLSRPFNDALGEGVA